MHTHIREGPQNGTKGTLQIGGYLLIRDLSRKHSSLVQTEV
jgi:hypothetical protein